MSEKTKEKVKDWRISKIEFRISQSASLRGDERITIQRAIDREDYLEAIMLLLEHCR